MRLRKGKGNYKVEPPIGALLHAAVCEDGDEGLWFLAVLSPDELLSKRIARPQFGMPKYLAVGPDATEIYLWPVPEHSYQLRLHYYPPSVES